MTTVVNTLWHGRGQPLPRYIRACIRSFRGRGHAVRLFSYETIDAPAGIILADGREVLERSALDNCRSLAAFSDAFRYALLLKEGGWWVDADVVCLTDTLPQADHAWAEEEAGVVNNAILKIPQGDPIVTRLATTAQQQCVAGAPWGTSGPKLLTETLQGFDPPGRAGTTVEFYPLHWLEASNVCAARLHKAGSR